MTFGIQRHEACAYGPTNRWPARLAKRRTFLRARGDDRAHGIDPRLRIELADFRGGLVQTVPGRVRGHDGMVLVYQDGFGGGRADVEA
jgi:hypothetical protein